MKYSEAIRKAVEIVIVVGETASILVDILDNRKRTISPEMNRSKDR